MVKQSISKNCLKKKIVFTILTFTQLGHAKKSTCLFNAGFWL